MTSQVTALAAPVPTELVPTIKRNVPASRKSSGQKIKPQTDGQMPLDEAIRLNAYLKWETAGMPEGDGVAFWLAAERELAGTK